MILGATVGHFGGPQVSFLGELGRLIIQLIKALAAPLLFFAVLDAFVRTHICKKRAATMLFISGVNAAAALAIGLTISNALHPGDYLKTSGAVQLSGHSGLGPEKKIDFMAALSGAVPSSIIQPFVENSVISIIVLAILFGLALRRVYDQGAQQIGDAVATALRTTEVAMSWIVKLVPLAVFGVVAKTIGTQGFSPLKGLAAYVCVALLGLAIQVFGVYQLWILGASGIKGLKSFWAGARDAVVYALGASSSLATLPVTLKSLEKMGVSTESARLAACVGTNLNHDGILLYEAMAVLFVAQAHGVQLSMSAQALASVSCLVASFGIAGIPDAGLISLSLVLGTVGLPVELLPLMLTVDWVLSRARAMTNVISDINVAVMLDHFHKKDLNKVTS